MHLRTLAAVVSGLVASVGCAASRNERVLVRMAVDGDAGASGSAPPPPPSGLRRMYLACRVSGQPVKDFYEPIVAFARKNLIGRLDEHASADEARAYLVLPGVPEPKPREGIEIAVDPRAKVGRLRAMIKRGTWDAGQHYCLHVLRDGDVTTIVVKEQSSWIK